MDIDDMTDNTEMEERGDRDRETADKEGEEEETSFIDDQRRDDSVLIIDGSNPIFVRPSDGEVIDGNRPDGSVPNPGRDSGVMKRYMIHDKKQFLKDGLGITVNKGDGPSSTKLYDSLRTTTSEKTGKINGASYRDKKIIFMKGGKMEYSEAKSKEPYVNEFKELLKRAYKEHQKTPASVAERKTGVDMTQNTMDSIVDNVNERIKSEIDSKVEDVKNNVEITENELREIRGILKPKGTDSEKLKALDIESKNWREKAEEEGESSKGKVYETISEIAELKAEEMRLRLNQKPETDEVTSVVEEEAEDNDMTRFEKFKRWARENLVNLSALSISIAGIITTVIMAGRNALKKGADGLKKFANAVKNIVKKLWPILAPLGTLIAKIIELAGKGLWFLSKNLWLLVLAITYFVYNEYRLRRR